MATDDEDPKFNKPLIIAGAIAGGITATTALYAATSKKTTYPMLGEAEYDAAIQAEALQRVGLGAQPNEGAFCTDSVKDVYGTVCVGESSAGVETTTEVAADTSVGLFDIITSIF